MNKDRFIELLVKEVKHFYSNWCRSSLNDEEFCELEELIEEYEIDMQNDTCTFRLLLMRILNQKPNSHEHGK